MVGGSVVGGFNKTPPFKDDNRAAPFTTNISVTLNIAIFAFCFEMFSKRSFIRKVFPQQFQKLLKMVKMVLGWKWYKRKCYYKNTDAD